MNFQNIGNNLIKQLETSDDLEHQVKNIIFLIRVNYIYYI